MNKFNINLVLVFTFIANIFVLIYNIYFGNWYLLLINIIALGFCIYAYNLEQKLEELGKCVIRKQLIFIIILYFGALLGLLFVKMFFNTNLNDINDINNCYSFIGLIPGVVYGILNI